MPGEGESIQPLLSGDPKQVGQALLSLTRRRPHRKWQRGALSKKNIWYEGERIQCWIGRYRDYATVLASGKPNMPEIVLGRTSEITKTQARELLREEILRSERALAQDEAGPGPEEMTFRVWWDSWYQAKMGTWRGAGSGRSIGPLFSKHVLPVIGSITLQDVSLDDLKSLLNNLAKVLAKSSVHKIRVYLRQCLKEAASEEVIHRNPAENLPIPAFNTVDVDLYTPGAEDIRRIIAHLDPESALICTCLYLTGMRSGELFAMRWDDWYYDDPAGRFWVNESVYEGEFTAGKNESSRQFVYVPSQLAARIEERRAAKSPALRDFIFPNSVGAPLSQSNFNNRVLKPAAKDLKIKGSLTVRAFRRATGTEAQRHMTVKSAQGHLRHASATTTLKFYTKEIPADTRAALENMEKQLMATEKKEKP